MDLLESIVYLAILSVYLDALVQYLVPMHFMSVSL